MITRRNLLSLSALSPILSCLDFSVSPKYETLYTNQEDYCTVFISRDSESIGDNKEFENEIWVPISDGNVEDSIKIMVKYTRENYKHDNFFTYLIKNPSGRFGIICTEKPILRHD